MSCRVFAAAALVLAAAAAGVAVNAGAELPRGALAGRVTVLETGGAVAGAEVSMPVGLARLRAVTGADGSYVIGGVPAGEGFTVTAEAPDLLTAAVRADVSPPDTTRCDIALRSHWLELIFPDGGEAVFAGSWTPIRWTSVGIDSVRLHFSLHNGRDWIYIDTVPAPPGRYVWDVPDFPTDECRILIEDAGDSGLSDISAAPFSNSSK